MTSPYATASRSIDPLHAWIGRKPTSRYRRGASASFRARDQACAARETPATHFRPRVRRCQGEVEFAAATESASIGALRATPQLLLALATQRGRHSAASRGSRCATLRRDDAMIGPRGWTRTEAVGVGSPTTVAVGFGPTDLAACRVVEFHNRTVEGLLGSLLQAATDKNIVVGVVPERAAHQRDLESPLRDTQTVHPSLKEVSGKRPKPGRRPKARRTSLSAVAVLCALKPRSKYCDVGYRLNGLGLRQTYAIDERLLVNRRPNSDHHPS